MTDTRIPQAQTPHQLALGTDLDTGEAVTLDLDQHPHLLTAASTGGGVSSLLRRVAANALASGATVTIIDPKHAGFHDLADLPGLTLGCSPAEIVEEITAFHAETMRRYTSGEAGPRRLLIVDELTQLRARVHGEATPSWTPPSACCAPSCWPAAASDATSPSTPTSKRSAGSASATGTP